MQVLLALGGGQCSSYPRLGQRQQLWQAQEVNADRAALAGYSQLGAAITRAESHICHPASAAGQSQQLLAGGGLLLYLMKHPMKKGK